MVLDFWLFVLEVWAYIPDNANHYLTTVKQTDAVSIRKKTKRKRKSNPHPQPVSSGLLHVAFPLFAIVPSGA